MRVAPIYLFVFLGASACVDTNVARPADVSEFTVDLAASEVEIVGDLPPQHHGMTASGLRATFAKDLEGWSSPGTHRPARFSIRWQDKVSAGTWAYMWGTFVVGDIVLGFFGVPMGWGKCTLDVTFDDGSRVRKGHERVGYSWGMYTSQRNQSIDCWERALKLAIANGHFVGAGERAETHPDDVSVDPRVRRNDAYGSPRLGQAHGSLSDLVVR